MRNIFYNKLCPNLHKYYTFIMILTMFMCFFNTVAYASNIFDAGKTLIIDIYTGIVGISTVLAGCMSAVAAIGAKLSNNQHKIDQAWDWMRRIWIAWAIINGIGAFIAYIAPLFKDYATLEPGGSTTPTDTP